MRLFKEYESALALIAGLPRQQISSSIRELHAHILFMQGDANQLAWLSMTTREDDYARFGILANYWSLQADHELAIKYLKASLHIIPRSETHILMGHELIELRRAKEAAVAYCEALRMGGPDHRAFYGLGQVYELLESYERAEDYFKRAAQERCVLAACL